MTMARSRARSYTPAVQRLANDRWKAVGSRLHSKINGIGYNYRDLYFDTRFSYKVAPPFFAGTTYSLGPTPVPDTISLVNPPATTAMSLVPR